MKWYLAHKWPSPAILLFVSIGLAGCGPQSGRQPAHDSSLERVAWLGSVEGWGLLGLRLDGGPLAYLRAENLESPTWAPPELGAIAGAWPADDAVWVQFTDSRIALYDYRTGHLVNFDSLGTPSRAGVVLQGGAGFVAVPDERTLALVSESQHWRVRLDALLARLVSAGEGRVIAVVRAEPLGELVIFQPPDTAPLARRQVEGVRDLCVTPWGGKLYYLSESQADTVVHLLSLPDLADVDALPLPGPGRALAVTPSGHRLYVAVGRHLYVYDRLRRQPLAEIALPGEATALRFAINGASLLARLDGGDSVAVLRVGVDTLLGVIAADWSETLPAALPGGRVVAQLGGELVLYDALRAVELARARVVEQQVWLPVKWQPPRPRIELARREAARPARRALPAQPGAADSAEADREAPAGHYAVVAAARRRDRVRSLVTWLRSVGYPGVVDRHTDVMGTTWFRAMVGPYPSRERAEGAARSLSARYGYKPWILQVEEPADSLQQPAGESGAAERVGGEAGHGES